jgi:hypothetical protein
MAGNVFEYQVLKDTTERVVIKLTGKFDGTSGQEDNAVRIQANTLYGALNSNTVPDLLTHGGSAKPYYDLQIFRLWYDCANPAGGDVELFWNAQTRRTIGFYSGTYEYDAAGNWITIPNNAKGSAGCLGDIGIATRGMGANNSYTIVLDLRKNNTDYQRGQFNDPAAFNYPPYSMTP